MTHHPDPPDLAGGPAVPRVRVVVVNWNGRDHLARCLDALAALDWPPDRLDIVVVDNDSTDGSDAIAAAHPRVRLLRNDHNGGFVAANLALRDLDGVDYVGLVNLDSFVEPGWLRALVGALEADPGLGAATARMLFADRFVAVEIVAPTFVPGGPDGRELGVKLAGLRVDGADRWRDARMSCGSWGIEHVGGGGTYQWTRDRATLLVPVGPGAADGSAEVLLSAEAPKQVHLRSGGVAATVPVTTEPAWQPVPLGDAVDVVNNAGALLLDGGYGADRGYLAVDGPPYDDPADVFAWSGGSVLLSSRYLADVGLFDEHLFLYYEDTDLSWRGRSRGWAYRYEPTAVARHVHAASSGEASPTFQHHNERNRLLLLAKNAPAGMAARAAGHYLLTTASYARRDLLAPMLRGERPRPTTVRRRLGSFAGYLRLLPPTLAERRRVRRRATVPDAEVLAWMQPRPG